jgi:hypothetical protein
MMGAPDPVEASSTAVGPGPDPGRGVEVTPARTSDPSGPRLSAPMPNPRVRPCDEGHRAAVTVGTAVLERRCQHLMRRGVPNLRGGWAVKRSFAPTTTGSLKLVDVIEVAGLRKQHRRLRGTEGTHPTGPDPDPYLAVEAGLHFAGSAACGPIGEHWQQYLAQRQHANLERMTLTRATSICVPVRTWRGSRDVC